jgi:hypothetical protein
MLSGGGGGGGSGGGESGGVGGESGGVGSGDGGWSGCVVRGEVKLGILAKRTEGASAMLGLEMWQQEIEGDAESDRYGGDEWQPNEHLEPHTVSTYHQRAQLRID